MADEPTQTSTAVAEAPAATSAPAPESAPAAIEPTTGQSEAQALSERVTAEIDDLWAKAGHRDSQPAPEAATAETVQAEAAPAAEAAPKTETPAVPDPAEVERQVRAKIDAEARQKQDIETRLRNEQEHRQAYERYTGPEPEYQAVASALEDALAGDYTALDALDVVLPDGRRSSQVKGAKGLTQEEAVGLKRAWDTARRFDSVMGDRKVQRLVDLWNADIVSGRVLDHPDVDAARVTQHQQPHDQMAALRDSVIERVTKRLTDQHTEVI